MINDEFEKWILMHCKNKFKRQKRRLNKMNNSQEIIKIVHQNLLVEQRFYLNNPKIIFIIREKSSLELINNIITEKNKYIYTQ